MICDMESHLRNTDASTTPLPQVRTHTSFLACNTAILYNHALSCPRWLLCTCLPSPFAVEMSSKCFRGEQPERRTCLTLIAYVHAHTHTHAHVFLLSPRTLFLLPLLPMCTAADMEGGAITLNCFCLFYILTFYI